jgi:hypothetical protein
MRRCYARRRAPLAQLAEQLALNQRVRGSSPWRRTILAGQSVVILAWYSPGRSEPTETPRKPSPGGTPHGPTAPPLGQHGAISVTAKRGQWVARCRYRGLDGVTRHIQRAGRTRTAARLPLQEELRNLRGERVEMLQPNSRFHDATKIWLTKIKSRREDSTLDIYSHWLDKVVLPQLGELRLSECDVAQIDAFFTQLEQTRRTPSGNESRTGYAASTRRTIRAIVSGVLQQAVLHRAIPSNPVRELERIESPKGQRSTAPRGLTADERRRLLDFVDTKPGRHYRKADLPDLIRFALGSGLASVSCARSVGWT